MENLMLLLSPELIIVLGANLFFFLILLIMIVTTNTNVRNLRKKYNKFMDGVSDKNVEELLNSCLDNINSIKDRNREIENHINYIERNIIKCVQKVGIIRFNAFENVGSDLSFAIALLDSNDNGIVLSGIYSRDSSSTYAKPIIGGKSKYTLSAEEIQALDIARKEHGERLYKDK